MIALVLAVLAVFVIQTLLPGSFREQPTGADDPLAKRLLGNRDQMPPLTVTGQRAARALANMQEALPVFLALALMNMIVGSASLALTGALVFLIARVLYVVVYMAGIPVVRSLIWGVAWVGLGLMVVPLVDRL